MWCARTIRHIGSDGLEQCKDGSKMGVGSPEYILLLRKPQTDRSKGYADDPGEKIQNRLHPAPNGR